MTPPLVVRITEHARRLASAWRVAFARANGAQVGARCRVAAHCDIAPGFAPARRGTLQIGADCELEAGVVIHPYGGVVHVDDHVYVGPGVVIYGHGGVTIGEGTLIAMHCRILSSNHTIPPFGTPIRSQPDVLRPTKIGRDVWLGANVTVLGGVTIGDGCIVGAGAVVSRDLPPGSIAHGIPATVQRQREGSPPYP